MSTIIAPRQLAASPSTGALLVANTSSSDEWLPIGTGTQFLGVVAGMPVWSNITASDLPSLAGDVTGPINSNTVAAIQGYPVANTAPTAGNLLAYNGSHWAPAAPLLPAAVNHALLYGTSGPAWSAGAAIGANEVVYFNSSQQPVGSSGLTFDGNGFGITAGSTSEAPLTINGIASQAANMLNVLNSSGLNLFAIGPTGSNVVATGTSGVGLYLRDANVLTSGTIMGAVSGAGYSTGTTFATSPSMQFVAEANWSSASAPGGIFFATIPTGSTTQGYVFRIRGNGDIETNGAESTLSTSQTAPFLYLGAMAGAPTGTPGGHAGQQPIVYDSTHNVLWGYTGTAWASVVGAGSSNQTLRFNGAVPTPNSTLTNDGNGIAINMGSASEAGLTINGIASATAPYANFVNSSAVQEYNFAVGGSITRYGNGIIDSVFNNGGVPNAGSVDLWRIVAGGAYTGSTNINAGSIGFFTDAAWSSTSVPLSFAVALVPTGTTGGRTNIFGIHSNGDVVLNSSGIAVSASATGGFTFLPNCAGQPTGSPAARTGSTATIYDTTNDVLWVNDGTRWTASFTSYAAAYASGATLGSETVANVTSGSSSVTITPQSSPPDGKLVTIIKADNGSGTVTVGSLRGITGGSYTISTQYHSCTIRATGGNWYYLYGN